MKKVVCFFDHVGYESDMEDMKTIIAYCREELKEDISLYVESAPHSFAEYLSPGCLAIIDYGALSISGVSISAYDRYMLKIIENNPSITFVFRLTMGKEYYADELFEFPNVSTIDVAADLNEWVELIKTIN
jgi:hypothetical protein